MLSPKHQRALVEFHEGFGVVSEELHIQRDQVEVSKEVQKVSLWLQGRFRVSEFQGCNEWIFRLQDGFKRISYCFRGF